MLRKEKSISKIEIINDHIQIRYSTKVFDGDVLESETYQRECFSPDCDISKLPEEVKPYASIVFTEEAKKRYELKKVKK